MKILAPAQHCRPTYTKNATILICCNIVSCFKFLFISLRATAAWYGGPCHTAAAGPAARPRDGRGPCPPAVEAAASPAVAHSPRLQRGRTRDLKQQAAI